MRPIYQGVLTFALAGLSCLLIISTVGIVVMMCSEHFHVFIGDLSQDVESHQLREAFTPFGAIS